MKEPWSISKDKLVDLEEGTSRNEEHECAKPVGRNDVCKQAIQCVKLFLYLGLLMIVGWACYSIWQPYHTQSMEVKVTATVRELESQKLLLIEEQPTHETSTIAARPFYGSEDSKKQDAVDDLQKLSLDDQDEMLNSENTESSLDWQASNDYPDLPKGMNFPFFLPSFSPMKVDESEKKTGSSESPQELSDISIYNISEESQQLREDEKMLLENYMLLSLLVQNSVRISEALKDSKEVVDPKFQFKLENSSQLESDKSSLFQWTSLGQLESQREIGSDRKDSEEKQTSTQTDDNYESATLNILNNAHQIVPHDSTEPEQEDALIKSNEQKHQLIDSADEDWFPRSAFGEREYEEEQSLLEKSTVRNAEASEDSTEDPLEFEGLDPFKWLDSDPLALEDLFSLKWEHSGLLESQKEIDSDLEDSEEKSISTQIDDNYESATLNILNNTQEIVPEDSTEPEQEEALIKSTEQMHQLIDSADEDWFPRSSFGERKYEEEQSLLEKSTVRSAEASEDSTEGPLEFEGLDPFEWQYSDRLALADLFSLKWEHSGLLESQKEIDTDLEDSEDKSISTQIDDNYESATLNILNNTQEIVPEDSTEPEQEEALIKSNEQMHQLIDSADEDWFPRSSFGERKYEEEQSLLEKSTVRSAEASEDSTEGPLEFEGLDPFEWQYSDRLALADLFSLKWEHSGLLESQKEIDTDLEDSEDKSISTQIDDNYESATLNILNNTQEIVPEDSTEPEQEEALIKSNEQMHQSIDSADEDWFDQSASEDREHEEEQAIDETAAEIEDDKIGSSLENESDKESELDSFDRQTYTLLVNHVLGACSDTALYVSEPADDEDTSNSHGSAVINMCNESIKEFCEYWTRKLKFTDCPTYITYLKSLAAIIPPNQFPF